MPKKAKERSAVEVKRLSKKPGFHAVGGVAGLHLNVTDNRASWILRVQIGEKRLQIERGVDPREARRAVALALRAAQAKALTFDQAAQACHAAKMIEFKNAKHRDDWISSLNRYASPTIGDLSGQSLKPVPARRRFPQDRRGLGQACTSIVT